MKHYAILPAPSQKIDSYAIINMKTGEIHFSDKKRQIDGNSVYVLPEILLECSSGVSAKEAVKIVRETANEVAEEYGVNSAVAVSKALSKTARNPTPFPHRNLPKIFFRSHQLCKRHLKRKSKKKKYPKT